MSNKALVSLEEAAANLKLGKLRPDMQAALTIINAARVALEIATTFDEKRDITNKLESFKIYFQRSRAEFAATQALAVQWLKGLGAMGQWLDKNVRHQGGRPKNGDMHVTVLPDGITKKQSERLQRIAEITPKLDIWATDLSDIASMNAALRFWVELFRPSRTKIPPMPSGKYRVFYADPPWQYNDSGVITPNDNYGRAKRHYPTMSIDELCAMGKRIKAIAEDNAVLFLWTTSPMLEDAFNVIEAWGFEYKTSFVWDKVKHNFGHYNSVRHEFLLVCTRGSCTPDADIKFDSVVSIERSDEHSEKPAEFRNIIETLYTRGKRIELFARGKHDNWNVWGNEAG